MFSLTCLVGGHTSRLGINQPMANPAPNPNPWLSEFHKHVGSGQCRSIGSTLQSQLLAKGCMYECAVHTFSRSPGTYVSSKDPLFFSFFFGAGIPLFFIYLNVYIYTYTPSWTLHGQGAHYGYLGEYTLNIRRIATRTQRECVRRVKKKTEKEGEKHTFHLQLPLTGRNSGKKP